MKRSRSLAVFLVAVGLTSFALGQTGVWKYSDGEFYYELELRNDSSFQFVHGFSLGFMRSAGKWKQSGDTVLLYNYPLPNQLGNVSEEFISGKKDTVTFEVTQMIRGPFCGTLYVDDQGNEFREQDVEIRPVSGFEFWVNGRCSGTVVKTNEKGEAKVATQEIASIGTDFEAYSVQNRRSNYFKIYLGEGDILLMASPSQYLRWKRWLLIEGGLVMLECGMPEEDTILKQ